MPATRVSPPCAARSSAASTSSLSTLRDTSTTFTPSAAIWRQNSAPMPTDAPATTAHGPYLCANPLIAPLPVGLLLRAGTVPGSESRHHLVGEELEAAPAQLGRHPAHERVQRDGAVLLHQIDALVGRHD